MEPSTTHQQYRSMFPALVDEELDGDLVTNLRAHLEICAECRNGWKRYERAVTLVRNVPREKAPAALSTVILRRIRRRKSAERRKEHVLALAYRTPYSVAIPIILALAIAAFLFFLY